MGGDAYRGNRTNDRSEAKLLISRLNVCGEMQAHSNRHVSEICSIELLCFSCNGLGPTTEKSDQ
jgi:hypothetical protein